MLGMPLLVTSLIGLGLVIHWVSGLPRWLRAFPIGSGAIRVLSPIGSIADPLELGFMSLVVVSARLLLLCLAVESVWLMARGSRAS